MKHLFFALLLSGCYAPHIEDGAFTCATSNLCPIGFRCVAGYCVRPGSAPPDLGPDGSDGSITGPFFGNGSLGDLDLTGQTGLLEFNSETGEVRFVNAVRISANPLGFEHLNQSSGPPIALWNFRRLVIDTGVTVRASSNSVSVLVLAGEQEMTMNGKVELAGRGAVGGAAGANGTTQQSGAISSGGGAQPDASGPGGGGAGYAAKGTMGGGTGGGAGGDTYGTTDLLPIHFGSGGGGGNSSIAGAGGRGGGGGGAIALVARTLTIGGTIDVSGLSGGDGSTSAILAAGGGGGGSGGSLLLSGGTIQFKSGHRLTALGGKAGMGVVTGQNGGDGGDGRIYIAGYDGVGVSTTPTARVDVMPISALPR
jgi:hypothetical protein